MRLFKDHAHFTFYRPVTHKSDSPCVFQAKFQLNFSYHELLHYLYNRILSMNVATSQKNTKPV